MMRIDLNSDLGEHTRGDDLGSDAEMLAIVTSANVSCGFHAGDPRTLLATLREAADRSVQVGAHLSYLDRAGFGRRPMEPTSDELFADAIYQLGALHALARAAGTRVTYVKPHGALYNTMAHDARQAAVVIDAIRTINADLPLVALAGSPLIAQAEAAGLRVVPEAFADRAYEPDGTLVSRTEPGAVLHDAAEVASRMAMLVTRGVVIARDGSEVALRAESICVHGDSASAVEMAHAVHARLSAAGVRIASFMEPT